MSSMLSLQFQGAAGTVTGSCYKIRNGTEEILVDCGMFQGVSEIELLNLRPFDFNPSALTGMILTHAHLDHCGRMPLLVQQGYDRPIYMTEATAELLEIALNDMAKIQERYGDELVPCQQSDADKIMSLVQTINYHEEWEIGGFRARLINAGHILGSGSVILESIETGKKLVMSGDIGNWPQDLIQETEMVDAGDFVVMESTYGNRNHAKEVAEEVILNAIKYIETSGGAVLIPVFAIERSQELLHLLGHLKSKGLMPMEMPVFLDSPMAIRVTRIYGKFRSLWSEELLSHKTNPFDFIELNATYRARESERIYREEGPKIIIAGSGMMTGGRVLKHAQRLLNDERNLLLFVGYQAEDTLGREILEGESPVDIDGIMTKVRAKVVKMSALSSHADQPRLLRWLEHIKGVRQVYLTHGEDEGREGLKQAIGESRSMRATEVNIPNLGDEVELV